MSGFSQGEVRVWVQAQGSARQLVTVVSSDLTGEYGRPLVVPVVGRWADLYPYVVPLADGDPVDGSVVVGMLRYVEREWLGETVGRLTGASLHLILDAVFELLAPEAQ